MSERPRLSKMKPRRKRLSPRLHLNPGNKHPRKPGSRAHLFKPGHKPERKNPYSLPIGRPKGAATKTTRIMREALILAAEAHGSNGKGYGGVVGFLKYVLKKDYKVFCQMLGKLIPIQVTGSGGGPIKVLSLDPAMLRGLSEEELSVMERVMSKIYTQPSPEAQPATTANGATPPQIEHKPEDKVIDLEQGDYVSTLS